MHKFTQLHCLDWEHSAFKMVYYITWELSIWACCDTYRLVCLIISSKTASNLSSSLLHPPMTAFVLSLSPSSPSFFHSALYFDMWPWGGWPHSRTTRGHIVHISEFRKKNLLYLRVETVEPAHHDTSWNRMRVDPPELRMRSITFILRSDFKVSGVSGMFLCTGRTFLWSTSQHGGLRSWLPF